MIFVVPIVSPILALIAYLVYRWHRRRPIPLPTGWEWRVFEAQHGDDAGAELFDQVADVRRAWIRRLSSGSWRTSRGEVDGDIINAMRHVERELSILAWRVS